MPGDAEQLSRVMEFSICTKQPLWILFLAYSEVYTRVILSVLRQNIYMFGQEIFVSAATFDVDVGTFGGK